MRNVLCLLVSAVTATAGFVNFEGLPATTVSSAVVTPQVVDPVALLLGGLAGQGVTFDRPDGTPGGFVTNVNFSFPSGENGFAGLNDDGLAPHYLTGRIDFRFVVPGTAINTTTDYLSFYWGDFCCDTDAIVVTLYGLGGNLLLIQEASSTEYALFFAAIPGTHRVRIDWAAAHSAGYAIDDLSWNSGPAVPEPTSFAYLALAGVAGGLWRLRSRRAVR